MELNRRDLLYKCLALGAVTLGPRLTPAYAIDAWLAADKAVRRRTPSDQLGPFYKRGAPNVATLCRASDPGLPLAVSGTVYSTRGEALPGAKIEIWHAGHLGHYDLTGYRYRGTLITGAEGPYAFQSVLPGHYPARRCQHIHFLVNAPGHRPLVTQMYFGSDSVFKGDPAKNPNTDDCPSIELVRPIMLLGYPEAMTARATFDLVVEPL
jgi:protocatechuate 3,4-dioxygenase beta subunit